jgi:TetR/AcrR family transcriptional regulator, lmrAB and yxaGH operons repressor
MTSSMRDQIIQTTCDLLENQGYHATGLNQIVKVSGAPKGSLYYYFPEGKEEISSEAVLFSGRLVAERVRQNLAEISDPAEAIQNFVETLSLHVEASGFRAGGPLTTVASETATTSERLNLACREAYTLLQDAFKQKFLSSGLTEARSVLLALTITATLEGAIILSRTYHTGEPLRQVASQLACLVRGCESDT